VLRLYAGERPRAVIVGWDTLEAPTKRHEMFPAYQSGREFDDDLIEQLKGRCHTSTGLAISLAAR
jgi:DNA polymerase I